MLSVFAPSLPLLISHQLGSFSPKTGLALCGKALDFVQGKTLKTISINSSLKSAKMDFIKTEDGFRFNFLPDLDHIANNESLESGVLQIITNYFTYVKSGLENQNHWHTMIILRQLIGITVSVYLALLEKIRGDVTKFEEINWSPVLAADMANNTLLIIERYRGQFISDNDARDALRDVETAVIPVIRQYELIRSF